MDYLMILAGRVRRARKQAGLTQEDLASVVGCSTRTIHRLEKGHRIDERTAGQIKAYLDIGRERLELSSGERALIEWLREQRVDPASALLFLQRSHSL